MQRASESFSPEAKWIWLNEGRFPQYQDSRFTTFCPQSGEQFCVASFEKVLALDHAVNSADILISADVKYRLFLNDMFIGRGPSTVSNDFDCKMPVDTWSFDRYSCQLKAGDNYIRAEVISQPIVMADVSMGRGGFLFELRWQGVDGEPQSVTSGPDWLAGIDARYISPYRYDAGGAAALFPCSEIPSRWRLRPRTISYLYETRIAPCQLINPFCTDRVSFHDGTLVIRKGAPASFWLEFDKTYSAYICAMIKGYKGTVVAINAQEIIGRTDRTETIIAGGVPFIYRGLMMQSVHYLNVVVSNMQSDVQLQISVDASCYDGPDRGSFRCNDTLLNDIYRLGVWTTRICRQHYHMDSPIHQEPSSNPGDYLIQSLVAAYAFGDYALARSDILRIANYLERNDYRLFHPSFSLLWIQMLWHNQMFSADRDILRSVFPQIQGVLNRFAGYIGESGLIDNPLNYMFMDWVQVGEYNLHHPPRVMGQGYLSALYYQGLKLGAEIATRLDMTREAQAYERQAEALHTAFEQLWDPERNLYIDGLDLPGDTQAEWRPTGHGRYYSQHTNTLSVLYGLAPTDRHEDVMRKVMTIKDLAQAQPYFFFFIFEALHKVGLFEEYGIPAMRRWKVLLDECSTGMKEVWDGFDCDYSHAFAASPSYHMPARILGVYPTSPAFKTIRFDPQLGDLEWAEGDIPTPQGVIRVRVDKHGRNIELPDGVTVD